MELAGRVVVVTGASRGIGRATAVELGKAGMKVVVHYGRSAEQAKEVVAAVREAGGEAFAHQGDFSDRSAPSALIEAAVERFGALHALVNNAGIARHTPLTDLDLDEWDLTMEINVTAAMLCARQAVPHLRRAGSGVIVNIASIAGLRGSGSVAYATSKSAVIGLSLALAWELSGEGIRSVAIAPGLTDTDMLWQARPSHLHGELAASVPLGRIGRPEEMAATVRFALENDYLTGEVINVSGGSHQGF